VEGGPQDGCCRAPESCYRRNRRKQNNSSAKHLASWVGACPGDEESAEESKSHRSPKGNRPLGGPCMVNDESRRSRNFKDELGGKPARLGCMRASERLSFTCLGKASRGKPRRKPESGNPTFRDCRGARGNVTLSFVTKCARLGSIPTWPSTRQTCTGGGSIASLRLTPLRRSRNEVDSTSREGVHTPNGPERGPLEMALPDCAFAFLVLCCSCLSTLSSIPEKNHSIPKHRIRKHGQFSVMSTFGFRWRPQLPAP
jgi:Transposase IS116/IS110/IS902 family